MTTQQDSSGAEGLFSQALQRYQAGEAPEALLADFEAFTQQAPKQSAGWTCLAWLQLLCHKPEEALRSARYAVKLNPQDPQGRINLSLALLETGGKGVREHIDLVRRVMALSPEMGKELNASIADGLQRRPGWPALEKVKAWLAD